MSTNHQLRRPSAVSDLGIAQGDKTLVGWQQVFDTAQEKARIAQWVTPANEQNLDRLQAEVEGPVARNQASGRRRLTRRSTGKLF